MQIVDRETVQRHVRISIADMLPWWEVEDIKTEAKKEMGYAILSHRWFPFSAELTFLDLQELGRRQTKRCPGHLRLLRKGHGEHLDHQSYPEARNKLQKFCDIALCYKCKYAWVDTCCINRKSSADLEESIRSMFDWYRQSKICIVHLRETMKPLDLRLDNWFARGWTLQELLAPASIKFFDKEWRQLTRHKDEKHPSAYKERHCKLLWDEIARITKIPKEQLFEFRPESTSVREKMVWASRRKTSRIEDKAYCLIGIFNVSLTIAYGERERAFHRLQVEIMRNSNDTGLFIWEKPPNSAVNSMFAAGPECFLPRENILPYIARGEDPTFSMTNYGLRMRRRLYDLGGDGRTSLAFSGRKVIILGHTRNKAKYLGVILKPSKVSVSEDPETRSYEKDVVIEMDMPPSRGEITEIFIK